MDNEEVVEKRTECAFISAFVSDKGNLSLSFGGDKDGQNARTAFGSDISRKAAEFLFGNEEEEVEGVMTPTTSKSGIKYLTSGKRLRITFAVNGEGDYETEDGSIHEVYVSILSVADAPDYATEKAKSLLKWKKKES